MWYLMRVRFPEGGDDFLQIQADSPTSANRQTKELLKQFGLFGANETVVSYVQDQKDSPFTNAIISGSGILQPDAANPGNWKITSGDTTWYYNPSRTDLVEADRWSIDKPLGNFTANSTVGDEGQTGPGSLPGDATPPPTGDATTEAPPPPIPPIPPPQPPAGGYTGSHNVGGQYTEPLAGGSNMAADPIQPGIEETNPYGVFGNYFKIPAFGASPFQRWQGRQAGPTIGAYRLMQKYKPELSLSDYLGQTGVLGARKDIDTEYEKLVGGTGAGTAADLDIAKTSAGDAWDDILGEVIAKRKGRAFAGAISPRLGYMQQQYEATPAGFEGAEAGDYGFLKNYLRARFGI